MCRDAPVVVARLLTAAAGSFTMEPDYVKSRQVWSMSAEILIVDDECGIVDGIAYALRTEGFHPVGCSTGGEALEVLRRGGPALVILDVGLPDGNGFDLFREIRRLGDIPVIFLTARKEEVDRVVGLELGADDYVTKPFSPRELTARVRAVLRRSRAEPAKPPPAARPPAAPFVCDERKNLIHYFGTPLKTSLHEFRLLHILLQHPGWVYSRQQLMELAWEEPDASLLRTVDAHIKNLRRKLRAVRPDIEPIVTHRGCGYSLREEW